MNEKRKEKQIKQRAQVENVSSGNSETKTTRAHAVITRTKIINVKVRLT